MCIRDRPTPVDPTVSVDLIEPERLETEFFRAERWGFSLRPPMGWSATVLENAVQLKGEASEGDFSPSLSILVFEVGALSPVEYTDLLKAEQESRLKAYHLIEEHPRSFGGQEGVELIASGRYNGRDAIVRQGLIVRDGKVWLLSGVTSDREPEGAFGLLEESLATLQFDAESGN